MKLNVFSIIIIDQVVSMTLPGHPETTGSDNYGGERAI